MKNKNSIIIMTVLLISILFSFSAPRVAGSNQIMISHVAAPGTPRDQAAHAVKDYIDNHLENWEGRVYPAAQLGDGREQIESLQSGVIQMVILPSAFLGGFEPKMTLLDIPFFLPSDFDKLIELQNSEAADALLETTTDHGILSLGFWQTGYKQWTANKPMIEVEDFDGVTWRIMPSPVIAETYRQLGARPVNVPFGETYSALQTGAADGHGSSTIPLISYMNFQEVQDYITISNYGPLENVLMASQIWYDSLSEEDQQIIQEAANEGARVVANAAREEIEMKIQEIKDQGGTEFIELTEEEIEEFRSLRETMVDFYIDEYGEEAKELIEKYEKTMEELE